MPLHVALHHETRYRYDRRVSLGPQTIRLRPAPHCRTPVLSYSLRVSPEEHFLNWQQDPQGNFLARAVFPEPTAHLDVTVDLVAEMAAINPFDFFLEASAESYPFGYEGWLAEELAPFLVTEPVTPRLGALVERFRGRREQSVQFLVDLNETLQRTVEYVVRMEPGVQTPEETLELGRGS
ncbi:MAG TPA: IMP dehydrogenase, partial [Alphaproteobacteria bacterium]|nr:IMP dehydrogenase [Alphaproteobacteria bacterium]